MADTTVKQKITAFFMRYPAKHFDKGQLLIRADEKAKKEAARPADYKRVLARVKYFLENLDQLLIQQIDPIKKAQLFAVLFNQTSTYEELKLGKLKTPLFTGVNPVFALLKAENSLLVNSTSRSWNTLWPSIMALAERIEACDPGMQAPRDKALAAKLGEVAAEFPDTPNLVSTTEVSAE